MNPSPAEVFTRNPDIGAFRKTLISLDGDFPFSTQDMIRLGETYLKRFPERYHDRDMSAVHLGYALVRICVVEKMVGSFPAETKALFRKALQDVAHVPAAMTEIAARDGLEEAKRAVSQLGAVLDAVRTDIEGIPKGMIKERFMGGISYLFNVLYLMRFHLGKLQSS